MPAKPEHDYLLLRIQNAAAMLTKHEKETHKYRNLLDNVIEEAHNAGVHIVQLGLAAKLSRPSIYKAIKRAQAPRKPWQ